METQSGGQAPNQASIEARAAAIFSDPVPMAKPAQEKPEQPEQPEVEVAESPSPESAEAPQTETEVPATEETFDFEIDGTVYALPKALQKAVQQQKDYTQKTMEIAEQRKTLELVHERNRVAAMQQEFNASIADELTKLQAYDAVLSQEVDWAQLSNDQKIELMATHQQWGKQRDQLLRSLQEKRQEFQSKQDAAFNEFKAKANELLTKKIPNWSEDTQKAIRDHAISDGYTEAELKSVSDPRMTLTLWKASQYDLLKSKATPAVNQAKTVKTTPSNPMPQQVKDKLNFRKALSKAQPNEKRKLVEARAAQLFK